MLTITGGLVAGSAGILLVLGALHLLFTFRGTKLHPRDPELRARMEAASPALARETSMWKAWVGFNASHSLGAMLFGLVYGYLALAEPAVLFGSPFLLAVGFGLLASFTWLGHRYWFSVPFRGIVASLVLFAAGIALSLP